MKTRSPEEIIPVIKLLSAVAAVKDDNDPGSSLTAAAMVEVLLWVINVPDENFSVLLRQWGKITEALAKAKRN